MLAARDGNMTDEQAYFILAMEQWKAENKEAYPKWSDIVEVMRLIGYRKVQESCVEVRQGQDWVEKANTPHGVKTKKHEVNQDLPLKAKRKYPPRIKGLKPNES